MIFCMPHIFKVSQKTCKRSYAGSILEWCTKRGHDKATYLSHKTKSSKDATKTVSIDLIAENVRAGTLVQQGRKWRKGHTSIKMT